MFTSLHSETPFPVRRNPADRSRPGESRPGMGPAGKHWIAVFLLVVSPARADQDRWQVGLSGTGVFQRGAFSEAEHPDGRPIGDTSRGSVAADLDVTFRTSDATRIYAAASYAEGNGLDGAGGVSLRVNADDLEDDVKNINGRSRDYLLEANFVGSLDVTDRTRLTATAGIIDSTRYIDTNRVANDEIRQFMNGAFVNKLFLPSYDPGLALVLEGRGWSANGVWMRTRAQDSSGAYQNFDFFAIDVGTRYRVGRSKGRVRLVLQSTSASFGPDHSAVHGVGLSMDHDLSQDFRVFARLGLNSDEPEALVHKSLFSGGLEISGQALGLPALTTGLAYAYLRGVADSPDSVRFTRAWEGYARWNPLDQLGISLDIQWIEDNLRDTSRDPRLWAVGLRIHYAM